MNKKTLLFVTEKWTDGNPDIGLTNSTHNLFGSFQHSYSAEEYNYKTIHFDEIYLKGKHIDTFANQINEKIKPDVLVCTLLGTMPCNPTEKFFEVFKNAGVKIIFIWPDFGTNWTLDSYSRFNHLVDSHIAIAGERTVTLSKVHWMWTPEDPAYFYPPRNDSEKNIDVLFLGTVHNSERQDYLNFLKPNLKHLNVYFGGGQRHEKLSHEKYAELTRTSKIVINFPYSPAGNDQIKGRVFEAIYCQSLLMERKNKITCEFFEPNVEYCEFESKEELVLKINHSILFPETRKEIVKAASNKLFQKWTHNKFWKQVLETI